MPTLLSRTDFFRNRLKAEFCNIQWSWGAHSTDGCIYLQVWMDEFKTIDDKRYVEVAWDKTKGSPGGNERFAMLEEMANGTTTYGVICVAKDTTAKVRVTKDITSEYVIKLVGLRKEGEITFAEVGERKHL